MKKTEYQAALKEAEAALRELSAVHKPGKWLAKNYVGAGVSRLDYLDVKIPHVRMRFSRGFSFSNRSVDEQWLIWDFIWNHSNTFETMLLASYWASKRPLEEMLERAQMVFSWVEKVDNWAHSDEMSAHCAKILETDHRRYLPVFESWSKSKNPWLRRQSLVGLLFYSRMRKRPLPFTKIRPFIERQMDDDHFYVQKGVGWTLRECWNLYPTPTVKYLMSNARRIPSAGWTAATEKLPKKTKALLSERRKKVR